MLQEALRKEGAGWTGASAIIVAAGTGTRMGRPKQFLPLGGRPTIEWTLQIFLEIPEISEIILVMTADNIREHGARLASERIRVVEGGENRMESVRRGFEAVSPEADLVAVHDGARPLVTREIILAALEEAYQSGAALPAVPVKDTLKKVASKQLWISSTPIRSSYWSAQTPQCYRREILEEALRMFPDDKKATDESQLVERAGHQVRIVPSSNENIKITTPEDVTIAEALLAKRHLGLRPEIRSGFGFDIHRLVAGRELWLAGVRLEHTKGLLGHSDGDAVLHASCDAVLGGAGLGEIGLLFPPEDPKFKGIASREIVAAVRRRLDERGGILAHLDVTLLAEEPKIKPHYDSMRQSLISLWGLEETRMSLKAKSHEGLGEIGRGEAIACYAVATIVLTGTLHSQRKE
ncbi:MAG: 2-C-methyl-D-erythritol 4-phosphate cytidylyltransferase [Elusimicrobia bacterium]|nr:2-C-methyl-D-erythritol 4-phosphate cytidylyltransferase [Elusimicrobiota bacterium]